MCKYTIHKEVNIMKCRDIIRNVIYEQDGKNMVEKKRFRNFVTFTTLDNCRRCNKHRSIGIYYSCDINESVFEENFTRDIMLCKECLMELL